MKTACGKTVAIFAAVAALSSLSTSAFAADSWISCTGSVATVPYGAKSAPTTEASERVLAFNDEKSKLYQWSAKRNTLDPLPTLTYSQDKITWGAEMMNSSGMSWQGSLDRAKMKVDISRIDRDGVSMTWKERCRPTAPMTKESDAQVASSKEESSGGAK